MLENVSRPVFERLYTLGKNDLAIGDAIKHVYWYKDLETLLEEQKSLIYQIRTLKSMSHQNAAQEAALSLNKIKLKDLETTLTTLPFKLAQEGNVYYINEDGSVIPIAKEDIYFFRYSNVGTMTFVYRTPNGNYRYTFSCRISDVDKNFDFSKFQWADYNDVKVD